MIIWKGEKITMILRIIDLPEKRKVLLPGIGEKKNIYAVFIGYMKGAEAVQAF